MVRLVPVLTTRVTDRTQSHGQSPRNVVLSPVRNGPRSRAVRLPSLYPTVSLKSLNGSQPERSGANAGIGVPGSSTLSPRSSPDHREQDERLPPCDSPTRVSGTPVVVGATSVLRAATSLAVGSQIACSTVDRAEGLLQDPECQVSLLPLICVLLAF